MILFSIFSNYIDARGLFTHGPAQQCPTRYLRHEIDMAFYMDEKERNKMEAEVKVATDNAVDYIKQNLK